MLLLHFLQQTHRNHEQVAEKAERAVTLRYAVGGWAGMKLRLSLRHWVRFVRQKRQLISSARRKGAARLAAAKALRGITTTVGSASAPGTGTVSARTLSSLPTVTAPYSHWHSAASDLDRGNDKRLSDGQGLAQGRGQTAGEAGQSFMNSPRDSTIVSSIAHTGRDFDTYDVFPHSGTENDVHASHWQHDSDGYNRSRASSFPTDLTAVVAAASTLPDGLFAAMRVRWLRQGLLRWDYAANVRRRQSLCIRAGMRHYISRLASRSLHMWLRHARHDRRKRLRHRKWVLTGIFAGWKAFIAEQRHQVQMHNAILSHEERVLLRWYRSLLLRWAHRVRRRGRLRRSVDFLASKRRFDQQRLVFQQWKGKWSAQLFWRIRELQLESEQVRAVNEFNQKALTDLSEEAQRSAQETRDLEEQLIALQEQIAQHDAIIRENDALISEKEQQKVDLQEALETLRVQLNDAEDEQQRMKAFEEMLLQEKAQWQQEREIEERAAAEVGVLTNWFYSQCCRYVDIS